MMIKQPKILLADDDESTLRYIGVHIKMEPSLQDARVYFASNRDEAISQLNSEEPFDLAIIDLWMPDSSGILDEEAGLKVLEHSKGQRPKPEVIIITGYVTPASSLRAIASGAFDYITRPLDYNELISQLKRALEKHELVKESEQKDSDEFDDYAIIGSSKAMMEMIKEVGRIAPTDGNVLICGETGTGKELIARAIHDCSRRKGKPFIPVNCTAIPQEQLEAELFGIGKGVATQVDAREGKFREAAGGTLFLDEIGEIDLQTQPKLLRAIERKEIQSVGGKYETVDVRIIAATNRNLQESVGDGVFRIDLFYRFGFTISIPPLRERKSDVEKLATHFLNKYARRLDKNYIKGCEEPVLRILQEYPWLGNVRELENAIQYAVIACNGASISLSDLPKRILAPDESLSPKSPEHESLYPKPPEGTANSMMRKLLDIDNIKEAEKAFEKFYLERKLAENGWNVTATAEKLGLTRVHLHRKMKKLGLARE